ncbi:MAG TPA: PTS sugar transporter subunit IIC [Bacillota bacterium]|nr:PTS sugar transporter subunit IIC [Bacillota bacterium]
MKGIISYLEKHFVPVAAKIGAQRHLVAIRDGFVAIMPLIIAGSMAVLINNMNIPGYQNLIGAIFGDSWRGFGGNIWWGTFAIMSIFIAFTVAYNLAKSYDVNPLSAGVLSLANYFMFIPQAINVTIGDTVGDIAVPAELVGQQIGAWGNISWSYTNATALFGALLIAIVSTEIFVKLSKTDKLTIKMPDNVPPAVSKSFAALFPTLITISVGALLALFISFTNTDLFTVITATIQQPVSRVGNTMGAAILISFMNHLLWFFGLHGSNIIEPVMQSIYVPAVIANADAVAAGLKPTFIVTKAFFDAFVYMGGSGTTTCLIAAIYAASKRKHYRSLANLSVGPGLFNINESMIFGIPLVLNPVFVVPFILAPVALTIISYIATAIGLVPYTIAAIPWVTPPIIGGFLATGGSIMGALLSAVNLVVGFLIYMPFVLMAEKLEDKAGSNAELSAGNTKSM